MNITKFKYKGYTIMQKPYSFAIVIFGPDDKIVYTRHRDFKYSERKLKNIVDEITKGRKEK